MYSKEFLIFLSSLKFYENGISAIIYYVYILNEYNFKYVILYFDYTMCSKNNNQYHKINVFLKLN